MRKNRFLTRLWNRWKRMALVLGKVNSWLLLTLAYFLVLLPFGLVIKLFRIDLLKTRMSRTAISTYWEERDSTPKGLEMYKHPF